MVCEIMDVVARSCNGHLYEFNKLLWWDLVIWKNRLAENGTPTIPFTCAKGIVG